MNSDRAAAIRDAINGCPTVIDDDAIVEGDGEPFETHRGETLTGDRLEPERHHYRPAYIEQSGTYGNGDGAERPVFVVVLEPLWTETNTARTLPKEIVYEATKHDVRIRFYPPEHRLGEAVWFVDHFDQGITDTNGDRCPECEGTYFKIRDGEPECARCGYTDAEAPTQQKLITDGGIDPSSAEASR